MCYDDPFMIICMGGKLTTFSQVAGYISKLEMALVELEPDYFKRYYDGGEVPEVGGAVGEYDMETERRANVPGRRELDHLVRDETIQDWVRDLDRQDALPKQMEHRGGSIEMDYIHDLYRLHDKLQGRVGKLEVNPNRTWPVVEDLSHTIAFEDGMDDDED